MAQAPLRPLPLGREDVILITGGAKGITAECALALGQATGARLALVGQSAPGSSGEDEISRTLARCAAAAGST